MIIGGISHKSQTITFSSINKFTGSEEGYTSLLELKTIYKNIMPNLSDITNF
jgi:hypothetical protein